jgi:hypothetical protein
MKLQTANGRQQEATPERISEILGSGPLRGDLLILIVDDQIYLQALIAEEPCHVEYREGGESMHFYAKHKFSIPELEALMHRYLEGRPDWREGYDWAPLSEMESSSNTSWDITGI